MADVEQALRLSPVHDAGLAARAGVLAVKGDRSDPRFRPSARPGARDNQPDRVPGTRRLCGRTGAKPLSYIPSSRYVPAGSLKPLKSRNPRRFAAAPLWRCAVRTNFVNDRVICSVDRARLNGDPESGGRGAAHRCCRSAPAGEVRWHPQPPWPLRTLGLFAGAAWQNGQASAPNRAQEVPLGTRRAVDRWSGKRSGGEVPR
jgi:hypothetical protein